ncbi:uncharacterized protein N7483_012105 [Penicillium malachiteum]|uniref:uncharacterized protein n=1 Tax=Penicillium malachiteum TaxID=1324776 RepID=UPI0025488FA5|nr:uncharacterized protein N7483_012105 [Penicillium malachiteum]KAJ5714924.1 hypothetical protein N7483_012105 [Penicillium malachiteum]
MPVIQFATYTPPTWLARAHGPCLPQWIWQYRNNLNTLEETRRAFEHIKKDDDSYKLLVNLREKGLLDFTPFSFTEGPKDSYITHWFEANDDVQFHPKRDVKRSQANSWNSYDSNCSYTGPEEDPYVTSWFKAYPDVRQRPKFDILHPKNDLFEAFNYNFKYWAMMRQPERDERLGDALVSELFSHIISSTIKGPEPDKYLNITYVSLCGHNSTYNPNTSFSLNSKIKKTLQKLPIKLLSLVEKDNTLPPGCQPIGSTEAAGSYKACHRIAFIQQTELPDARGPSIAELSYLIAIMQDSFLMQNKLYKKLATKKFRPRRSDYFHHTSPVSSLNLVSTNKD